MKVSIVTFYRFFRWDDPKVAEVEAQLLGLPKLFAEKGEELRGLIILGREGINSTLSVTSGGEEMLKSQLVSILGDEGLWFKATYAERHPFHDYLIKIRNEIVTLNRTDIVPANDKHRYLSPAEWDRVMREEDPIVIDTRNSYEFDVGRFKNAIDPKIEKFSDFPEWMAKSGIPKDKKVLIYCTGGIRCEKGIYALEEQGYENSYHLEGGILNYLKEFPNSQFEGECFVFDYRVAVDQELQPTQKFKLCPHCGQPGTVKVECAQCGSESVNCSHCLEKGDEYKTCSKNCIHHFRMGHKTRRMHNDSFRKRAP